MIATSLERLKHPDQESSCVTRSRGKPPMPSFVLCHTNIIIPANNLPGIEQMNTLYYTMNLFSLSEMYLYSSELPLK